MIGTKINDFPEIHDFHGLNEIKRTIVFLDLKHPNQPEDLKTLQAQIGDGEVRGVASMKVLVVAYEAATESERALVRPPIRLGYVSSNTEPQHARFGCRAIL